MGMSIKLGKPNSNILTRKHRTFNLACQGMLSGGEFVNVQEKRSGIMSQRRCVSLRDILNLFEKRSLK